MNLNVVTQTADLVRRAKPQLDRLQRAAKQTEGIFLKDLVKEMRKSLSKDEFGQSYGGQVTQDLFNQTLADTVAKSGDFGVAKNLYRQFSKDVLGQESTRRRLEESTSAKAQDRKENP